jgi:hypothetical protein
MRARLRPVTIAALAALLLTATGRADEPPKPASSPLTLRAVTVTPATPGTDTLCELRVDVANEGDRIASQLGFTVEVNGQELPVYRNQLFMQRLDPGKTASVRLYNFWTSETSRPAPKDGKYRIEVTLREAKWYEIATQEGVEDWTPLSAVPGLPVTASLTVGRSLAVRAR